MIPAQFRVNYPFVQKKKRYLDSQDGRNDGHLGFPTRTISATFVLQITRYFLASFESNSLSDQGKKRKIDFQDGCHDGYLGILIGTTLTVIDLPVAPILYTKSRVD